MIFKIKDIRKQKAANKKQEAAKKADIVNNSLKNNGLFDYCIDESKTVLNNSKFSLKDLDPIELNKIKEYLNQNYKNHKWTEIISKDRVHTLKKMVIEQKCPVILKYAKNSTVFQIPLIHPARLIGYRVGDMFHIVAYDPQHKLFSDK